jgi:hypothetical protein
MQMAGRTMMQGKVLMVAVAMLAAVLATPAEAQWKWRDKNGRVQYSDQPPPSGVPDKDVLQKPASANRQAAAPVAAAVAAVPASAASGIALTPKTVEPELEAKRRKADEEKAAKDKAEEQKLAAARADNCSRARSQLRTIDDGIRIARTNATGEREILDDKARAEERRRTTDVIASDCK